MPNRLESLIEAEARRAKKVEQLVSLLRDPDLADFVAKLASSEQSGLLPFAKSGSIAHSAPSPNSLRGIIRSLELPQKFTARDVLARMDGKYAFRKADRLTAVRDAIYTLSRPGEDQVFRISQSGGGSGNEQMYERVA